MIDIEKFTKEQLLDYIIGKMETHNVRFSRMLVHDSNSAKLNYFEEKPQSWIRFKAECRKKGWYDLVDEVQMMEREMVVELLENELVERFSVSDADGVKVAVQALNGMNTRTKMDRGANGSIGMGAKEDSFESIGIDINED